MVTVSKKLVTSIFRVEAIVGLGGLVYKYSL
jgi:hypothetical protein